MITDRWFLLFRPPSLDNLSHGLAAKGEPSAWNNGAAGDDLPAASPTPPFQLDVGWRPWKVVIGCFFFTVPIYGLLSSIGLFQTYWRKHQLQEYSESEVSWIISMVDFMGCLFGAPAGILFDRYGVRWLLPLASAMYLSCFVGLAFSSNYGGFMGCLTMTGICAGMQHFPVSPRATYHVLD